LISSFAPQCLTVARAAAPDLPRGYLAGRMPRDWRTLMARDDCATLHLDQRWLGARQGAAVAATGIPLLLYTVNDAERARRLLENGVTTVITDHVGQVLAAVNADAVRYDPSYGRGPAGAVSDV
jgi:glycerophosphoryl diester phosphodiesterase